MSGHDALQCVGEDLLLCDQEVIFLLGHQEAVAVGGRGGLSEGRVTQLDESRHEIPEVLAENQITEGVELGYPDQRFHDVTKPPVFLEQTQFINFMIEL